MSELGPLLPKPPAGNSGGSASPAPATPATTPSAAGGAAVQTSAAVIQPGGPAPAQPQPQAPAQNPAHPPSQGSPPSPSTVLQDTAAEISASLRELARGGQVDATVIARDGQALLVRTAAGSTLSLPNLASMLQQANLAILNAALKLQINPENPQQATLTTVNGKPLALPLPIQVQPPTAAQLALAAAPPQPAAATTPALPQAGQTLTATVQPLPGNAAAQASLPPGSQVQVIVQTATLPAASPSVAATSPAQPQPAQAAQPAAVPPTQSSSSPPAAAPLPAQAGQPAPVPASLPSAMVAQMTVQASQTPIQATLQAAGQAMVQTPVQSPGQTGPQPQMQVPVSQALPQMPSQASPAVAPFPIPPGPAPLMPAAPVAANAASLVGQTLAGIVTGQSQTGQVLVSTPQGVLALSLPQPLPPGTQLALELAAVTRPPPPTPTALGPAPLATVLTRLQGEWPVLQQTLDAIRAADPALAQRLQAELLPQPNARLAATALQFMAAAAAGNAQAWLGSEAVRRLEQQGRQDLLRRLDDDFRELGRLNQRSGDNDWQALVMPMLIGGKVEPIHIFMRRRRDRRQQQQQTRFIIDFNLESTGPIQFDGLVGAKQLDLVLRSETAFGPAFRMDVSAIFEEAVAVTGMSGSLHFHDREAPLPWPSPELEARGPSTELKA